MKRAVHFGAGKIGRGFIADLLHDTGYAITFVDVNEALNAEMNRYHNYYLYVIQEGHKRKEIDQVSALSPITQPEEVMQSIIEADLVTTAVIADNFPKIAPNLAAGLKARLDAGKGKINVIPCENAFYCGEMLKKELIKTEIITEDELDSIAAIPSTAVDRMVFSAKRDGREGIDIGKTFELVIEKNKLADPCTEPIKYARYTGNLDKFLERKLCVVNGGHTMSAYIARLMGYDIIQDYFKVPENTKLTRDIMLQVSAFVEKKHGFTREEMEEYIDATISRWSTPGIEDTIERIAKAPIRKLDPEDRMVKPAKACEEYGLANDLILKGIAAAFLYDMDGDEQAAEITSYVKENGIEKAMPHYTGIEEGSRMYGEILKNYKNYQTKKEQ
ncbi:mannitol dehydrogenase [Anaerostipes caccae]|uniref:mannitol dehydrogenase family protein n=1 Tax=Anaerostipes caccae TaxID=105841 RepID=UPI00101C6899|nr:mannitol dehydrogenase [Anaerostipes caccae]